MREFTKRNPVFSVVLVSVLLGVIALYGLPRVASGEPIEIRFAHRAAPPHLTPLLYQKKDVMKHYGKSYTVKLIFVPASSPQISMLAAKELDIAWLAYASFASAVVNANLDLRIVADLLQYGAPGYFPGYFSVMKDSPIRDLKALKGKRIAVPAFGTALDMAARAALRTVGFEANRDYTPVEVRFPNMYAMLKQGKVDAASLSSTQYFDPKIQKTIRPLFPTSLAMGRVQALMQVARTDFLKKDPKAVADFFEDYLRAWTWFFNPANRSEALDLAARYTKRPRELYESYWLTKGDYFRDPEGKIQVKALQSNIDTMHNLGYLKRKLKVDPYVDMSYIEAAAKRIASQ